MKIEIDLLSHLKNMRQQFQSKDRWISEFVQNAQRSGATELRVAISKDVIIVSDNGCGCRNPKALFTIATSGWTDLQGEVPFGTGFFSTLAVAQQVEVRSDTWRATMDIADIFATNNLDVVKIKNGLPMRRGFEAILRGVDSENVAAEFTKECQFLRLRLQINGVAMSKKVFSEVDENLPAYAKLVISDPECEGVIYTKSFGDVETFHKRRRVENLYVHAGGRVEFPNANPRCPDRTAWLRDNAYYAAKVNLEKHIKQLYLSVWTAQNQDTIKENAEVIINLVPTARLLQGHLFKKIDHNNNTELVGESDLKDFKGFWASTEALVQSVEKAWHYRMPVVVSQNKVEDALLQSLSISNVSAFDKFLRLESNIQLFQGRPDVQKIFDVLAEISGFPRRLVLADIKVQTVLSVNGHRQDFSVRGICSGGIAYVQASDVQNKSTSEACGSILVTAAHEVAHLHGLDDGDPKHLAKQLDILESWLPTVISTVAK